MRERRKVRKSTNDYRGLLLEVANQLRLHGYSVHLECVCSFCGASNFWRSRIKHYADCLISKLEKAAK